MKTREYQNGSVMFILFAFVGLFIAGGLFLIAFITSQKAASPHPKANLRLIAPSIPPRPSAIDIVVPIPTVHPTPKINTIPETSPAIPSPSP